MGQVGFNFVKISRVIADLLHKMFMFQTEKSCRPSSDYTLWLFLAADCNAMVYMSVCWRRTHRGYIVMFGCRMVFTAWRGYVSTVYAVVMCLSISLSVTLQYCIKMAKCRITQIMPHDNPGTLVFWCRRSRRNSNGITPYSGAKC